MFRYRQGYISVLGFTVLAGFLLSSCGFEEAPSVSRVEWSVDRGSKLQSYTVNITADFEEDVDGKYVPVISMVDDKGCRHKGELDVIPFEVVFRDKSGRIIYASGIDLTRKVASAELSIFFNPNDGSNFPHESVFSDKMVVDASINPPSKPENACALTKSEQREKARASKGYASPQMAKHGELIATILNLNGLLCARVTDVRPLKVDENVFEVTCIEYRGGTGQAQYIVNASTGDAYPR
jgi:hypothetical protein